jgi:IMP dehydrogenase
MKNTLTYDDVLLVPQYSDIRTRTDVDISTDLGKGLELFLPIIASPMDTVSEWEMTRAMSRAGATAIVHRYNNWEQQCSMIKDASAAGAKVIGAAVGISGDYLKRSEMCLQSGATFICVDVAHGHHILMKEALFELRKHLGKDVHIMAGNVATLEGVNDLSDWGADSVRCNIGGGSICSTRIQTGHGLPGLQTIIDCSKTDRDVKIIADGGIKNAGDIVKALAAGADAVMCGSLLAGTAETPGNVFTDDKGFKFKTYRGMASKEAQKDWRGKYSSFEGVATKVPYRGPVASILSDLGRNIRSGLSYSGSRSLKQLRGKAQFIIQTTSGLSESRTHILARNW